MKGEGGRDAGKGRGAKGREQRISLVGLEQPYDLMHGSVIPLSLVTALTVSLHSTIEHLLPLFLAQLKDEVRLVL